MSLMILWNTPVVPGSPFQCQSHGFVKYFLCTAITGNKGCVITLIMSSSVLTEYLVCHISAVFWGLKRALVLVRLCMLSQKALQGEQWMSLNISWLRFVVPNTPRKVCWQHQKS